MRCHLSGRPGRRSAKIVLWANEIRKKCLSKWFFFVGFEICCNGKSALMKGISLVFGFSFLLCSLSQAGWGWNKEAFHGAKAPVVEQRVSDSSNCFDAGFVFSGFGSGFWPEDPRLNDAIGGGVSLAYFFGHNFGVEGSYMLHGSGTSQQVATFDLVYRFPLGGECCSTIAPYVFGGPGMVSAGDSEFLWNIGGGLDFRMEGWGCVGLFSDFSYNFVNNNQPDFTLIRAGIRFPF